jgi:diguanylate cyclase (GGDEF)-like protein
MSPWLIPIGVELALALMFCGALLELRKSLRWTGAVFWTALWAMRTAVSLIALHALAAAGRFALVLFAPLEAVFAVALILLFVRTEKQKDLIASLDRELASARKQAAGRASTDPLTGLLNRSALAQWIEESHIFDGLLVVCDMDDFKPLNDRYGHLAGDEILRGVGHLIRRSIREEDLAFRWGGDEFVIFFKSADRELVESRMRTIEERLKEFHLRQHEIVAVRFSWGIAPADGRTIRDTLAEADRLMYEAKRSRRANASKDAIVGE